MNHIMTIHNKFPLKKFKRSAGKKTTIIPEKQEMKRSRLLDNLSNPKIKVTEKIQKNLHKPNFHQLWTY